MTDGIPSGRREGGDPGAVHWSGLDLDGLIDAYWRVIAPAMRADGLDPETERPTHGWLAANGCRGIVYALREHHDRTFGEFWSEDLGLEPADDGYDWGIEHGPTIDALEAFLDSRSDRGDLDASSVDTLRYRLARYARAYAAVNGSADLLAPVAPDGDVPPYEATDAAWAAFDRLDDELAPRTTRRIHGAVDDWYAHLVRRKRAAVNPVAGLEDEYRWGHRTSRGNGVANPSLDPEHVQALHGAAESPEETLLVVALCAWGLRSGEVAALHRRQLVLDPEDGVPYVAFEERKNGPGQVSILFGRGVAEERLVELADREGWNGYLFPSARSSTGHVSRQTLLDRFDRLVERAGVPDEIDGRKPVPQMGRRFWYDAYSAAQEALVEGIGEVAAEQGSASAEVVLSDYLSAERRRTLRREHMRSRLAEAFDGEEVD